MDHRSTTATPAERLDLALDRLLAGARPAADPELGRLLRTGEVLAAQLRPMPAGERFAAHVRDRLARPGAMARVTDAVADLARRRRPSWLIVTGAVSTAAVGVGVTAFAVWRGTHRVGRR